MASRRAAQSPRLPYAEFVTLCHGYGLTDTEAERVAGMLEVVMCCIDLVREFQRVIISFYSEFVVLGAVEDPQRRG